MAKKSGLVAYRRRRKAKAKRSNISKPSSNPPLGEDLTEVIIPGFVAYAGTRFLARIVYSLASKRFPKGGKHVAVASSLAAFAGAWTLVHRFEKVEKYHTPAVMGSAIAAIQTVVQQYIPKYGWMMADLTEVETKSAMQAVPVDEAAARKMISEGEEEEARAALPEAAGDDYGSLSGGMLSISDADLDELEHMI